MYSFPFPLTIIFGTSMSLFLLHYSFLRYTSRPSSMAISPFPFFGTLSPLSLASAGNSERRSPRRIAREYGIPPLLQCPVILKNTPAK